MTRRRYIVTYNAVAHEVFPLFKGKQKYVYELEKDQIFKRKKLSAKLQFINDPKGAFTDYDFFKAIEFDGEGCEEIKITIQSLCNGQWDDEWKGFFSTGWGSFDLNKCLFEVLPEPDDVYRCIFENWETEYNMFDYPIVEAGIVAETCFVYSDPYNCSEAVEDHIEYCTGLGYLSVADMIASGWCYVLQKICYNGKCDDPDNLCETKTTWFRDVLTLNCDGGVGGTVPTPPAGWTLIQDDCAGSGTARFAKCSNGFYVAPVRGVLWLNRIENVVSEICINIANVESIFFDFNADVTDPHYNQFGAGTNYITQTTNRVNHLILSAQSDIVHPDASNPATICMFTLKMWLQWMREVFNCYWDITTIGGNLVFRIEHYDFYNQQLAIDLTDALYTKQVKSTDRYEHLKDEIPRKETFHWSEDGNFVNLNNTLTFSPFIGFPILYARPCAKEGLIIDHSPANLTTDVEWLYLNENVGNSEGKFTLIACEFLSGAYVPLEEVVLVVGLSRINGHLAWSNLHQNYHRSNRYLPNGFMNLSPTDFLSWKPNIKQPKLSIIGCCLDINPDGRVKTTLGDIIGRNAYIDKLEEEFTDVISFDLTYPI